MKNTIILASFLALAPFAKGQLLLEALESGIPFTPSEKCLERVYDKYYGDGDHNFIYCAVMGPNGKKWLNLNLGAEYAKESSPHFNPESQPTSINDWKAFGSLFQYGRKADGHELVSYHHDAIGNGIGTGEYWGVKRLYASTDQKQNPFQSGNSLVIGDEWNTNPELIDDFWTQSKLNNPCPNNYRVISPSDFYDLIGNNPNKIQDWPARQGNNTVVFNLDYVNIKLITTPIAVSSNMRAGDKNQRTLTKYYNDWNTIWNATSATWIASTKLKTESTALNGWKGGYNYVSWSNWGVEPPGTSIAPLDHDGEWYLEEVGEPFYYHYSPYFLNKAHSLTIRCVEE